MPYGSSWEDAAGRDQRAVGLAEEAIWLARVLRRDAIPDEPEVRGLLALLLHCEARRPARRAADGRFIPLSEQDPPYAPYVANRLGTRCGRDRGGHSSFRQRPWASGSRAQKPRLGRRGLRSRFPPQIRSPNGWRRC